MLGAEDEILSCCVGEIQRLLHYDAELRRSAWLEFAIAVSPIDIEQWKTSNLLCRLYAIFKVNRLLSFCAKAMIAFSRRVA